MTLLVTLLLIFASIALLSSQIIPLLSIKFQQAHAKEVDRAELELTRLFIHVNREKLALIYTLVPALAGLAGFFIFSSFLAALLCGSIGLALPTLFIRYMEVARRAKFQAQLVDGLMIMTSSLKAGLSLLQAIEVLVEEMPAPLSDEFGLVVRENKMGVTLDDSLRHLDKRLNMPDLSLVITAVLVAKETGGDLTKVISRLVTTIRDNRKLKENIKTLTMQGKLQGIIMSVLPIFFVLWVFSFNRHHFDIMLNNETGRMLLIVAVLLQLVGMFLIRKFSTIKI